MPAQTRQAVLSKWRQSSQTGRGARFLVAFDVIIKAPEIGQCPLVINYGMSEAFVASIGYLADHLLLRPSSKC